MADIDFQGRVALVTGAGGGLGRSYALLLAERGAKVVVNDLGGTRDGEGASSQLADQVVQEIKDAGGEAVANYDGVHTWEGGRAMVAAATETWGRLDILVNNAGILRDSSFAKLTPQQLDAILDVHLRGTFCVTKAAWDVMSAQGYGRVVNTSSTSSLYGNFGQTNYSAAKLGVVGFTRTLAVEGVRKGIVVNAIAPFAGSRLTQDVMSPEVFAWLRPEFVAPLVALLCSEGFTETGKVFVAGGGFYTRAAIVEGHGVTFADVPTPEALAARFADVMDVSAAIEPVDTPSAGVRYAERVNFGKES